MRYLGFLKGSVKKLKVCVSACARKERKEHTNVAKYQLGNLDKGVH